MGLLVGYYSSTVCSIACCLQIAWLHCPQLLKVLSTECRHWQGACMLLSVGSSAQHRLTEPRCATAWRGSPPCLSLLRDGHDTAVDDLSHALLCCNCSVPFAPICRCSVCHSLSPACQCLLSTLLICSTLHAETNALNQGPVWQHQAPFITSALHQISVYHRINCCR